MQILPFSEKTRETVITESLKVIKNGGIIAYPTESFYALGIMANNETAVNKLFSLKKRPAEKPMPVIIGSDDILRTIIKYVPAVAETLMKKFWPGPLTIIFESNNTLPKIILGDRNSLAVRIPGESPALYLARAAKFPITATSANISERPPADDINKVLQYFNNKVDLIIDVGKTPGGKPSTIIDVTVMPPLILRQGSVVLNSLK